ncbi:Core histone macro-H2A.1 [Echinococcus granulosus]|uniref:Core histone macro-H2A.1 n=1 Tax=Echinococcus granulosus TaxID=6210 RepID=W6UG74_ECHGR|nr:Core histone macro-H2A.1 [Echinococcus granulosus]EUB60495.1 Core histone macro-H2A.1 [Echinococcus granulosus]
MLMRKTQNRKKTAVSKSRRCGLIFPVARVRRLLKSSKLIRSTRISVASVVYLTAVLEYLSSEVVDLAGRVAKEIKRKTISPRSIMLAVRADEELLKVLSGVIFPFSGTTPYIYPSLLPQKSPRQPSTPRATSTVKGKVLHSIKLPLGQTLQIIQTDIAGLNVDAIVNPTDSALSMGGMVGSRLLAVGGAAFAKVMDDARSNITNLQKNNASVLPLVDHLTGKLRQVTLTTFIQVLEIREPVASVGVISFSAFVTKGTGIKASNVIHVNGPVWNSARSADCISDLRKTIQNCLTTAGKANFESIALPSIGSGRANFPKSLAAETIVSAIKTYLDQGKTSLTDVRFVLFDQASIDAYIYELNRTT